MEEMVMVPGDFFAPFASAREFASALKGLPPEKRAEILSLPLESAGHAVAAFQKQSSLAGDASALRGVARPEQLPTASESRKVKSVGDAVESTDFDLYESKQYIQHVTEMMMGRRKLRAGMRWGLLILVGVCTGLVAVFVDTVVNAFFHLRGSISDGLREAGGPIGHVGMLVGHVVMCMLLAAFAGYFVCYVEPLAAGSGIPEVKCYLNGVHIPHVVGLRTLLVKAVGVMFSVAAGLPCGKEGPMIHSGACIAALLSKAGTLPFLQAYRMEIETRDFVAAGAASGVAAAFGAPIGGVLFAMEEGASFFTHVILLRCFVCCTAATLVTHFFLSGIDGVTPWGYMGAQDGAPASFGVFERSGYRVWELLIFAVMGATGGLFGAMFNNVSTRLTHWRMANIPRMGLRRFLEVLILTGVVSLITFLIPAFVDGYEANIESMSSTSRLYRTPGTESLRSLFHDAEKFHKGGLLMFAVLYYIMACFTYGLGVPSGLFVPSLLTGAAFGRLVGEILAEPLHLQHNNPGTSDAGVYALVGATALLAGNLRITISLAAILVEASGSTQWAVPIFLTTMCAKWSGDYFNIGLYDIHIGLKRWPILESAAEQESILSKAQDVMRENPVTLGLVECVQTLLQTLESCNHNGFPVLDDKEKFVGLVRRATIMKLLEKGSSEGVFQEPDGQLFSPAPFFPYSADLQTKSLADIKAQFTPSDQLKRIDLSPFINQGCYTVPEHAALMRVYMLFRGMGLRHLPVVSHDGECSGIITRKDLIHAQDHDDSPGQNETAEAEKKQVKATLLGSRM